MSEASTGNAKNELVPTTGIFHLRLYAQVSQELEANPDFLTSPELRRSFQSLEERVGRLPDSVLDEVEPITQSGVCDNDMSFAEKTPQGYSKH